MGAQADKGQHDMCRVAEMMVTKPTVEDAIAFIKELEESLDIQIG